MSVSSNSDGIFICPFRMSMSSALEVECISPPTLAIESGTVESSYFMIESISTGWPAIKHWAAAESTFCLPSQISFHVACLIPLFCTNSQKFLKNAFWWNHGTVHCHQSISSGHLTLGAVRFPLSSAVRRSLTPSLSAIHFVDNETSRISMANPSSSANTGSCNAAWTLNTSYLFSCWTSFATSSTSWTHLDARLSNLVNEGSSSSSSKLKKCLISSEICDCSDHVTQNLSRAWSLRVMPIMPFCILQVLFIHSVAWSAGTLLKRLFDLLTMKFPFMNSAAQVQCFQGFSSPQGKQDLILHNLYGEKLSAMVALQQMLQDANSNCSLVQPR